MSRRQELRLVPGADTAILFIHGILGTPEHFKPFLPLIPSDWSICNLLLHGHCGSVKDFSAASMSEWKRQVHEALSELRTSHSRVVIAAHSMGTLFALQEAVALQEAIDTPAEALFLLNVPLRIRLTAQLLKTTWRVFRGNIRPDDVWMQAAQDAYGIERDHHILRYLGWIPRYLELFSEIRKTRKIVQKLTVKTQVYLSSKDEMVSVRSGKLFQNNALVSVKALGESGHFYYAPEDLELLQTDFCDMIRAHQTVPV